MNVAKLVLWLERLLVRTTKPTIQVCNGRKKVPWRCISARAYRRCICPFSATTAEQKKGRQRRSSVPRKLIRSQQPPHSLDFSMPNRPAVCRWTPRGSVSVSGRRIAARRCRRVVRIFLCLCRRRTLTKASDAPKIRIFSLSLSHQFLTACMEY
jgi:hypothetical protein